MNICLGSNGCSLLMKSDLEYLFCGSFNKQILRTMHNMLSNLFGWEYLFLSIVHLIFVSLNMGYKST